MPHAARRVHLPIFFLTIVFSANFYFSWTIFCSLQLYLDLSACRGLQTPRIFSGGFGGQKNQNHTSPHYSLMQPPAASMEVDVKEISMLILNILLKWPIIAKFSIGFWIADSSSLHGVWE
jgi:hypothetical protein